MGWVGVAGWLEDAVHLVTWERDLSVFVGPCLGSRVFLSLILVCDVTVLWL